MTIYKIFTLSLIFLERHDANNAANKTKFQYLLFKKIVLNCKEFITVFLHCIVCLFYKYNRNTNAT